MRKYFDLFSLQGKNYLLGVFICSFLIIYMQWSKFKWIVASTAAGHINVFQYCYSEIYFIVLFIFIILLSKDKRFVLIPFLIYYYLSVLNFTSWFIQGRPFSFIDIYRSFQLFVFYPEFLSKIETGLKIKLTIFTLAPFVIFLVVHLLHFTAKISRINFSQTSKRIIISVISLGVLSFPIGVYAKLFHYSTPVEIINNIFHELKIKQISRHPEDAYRLLGIAKQHKHKPLFNFRSKNIIFFIIETAPYDFYPSLIELCGLTDNSWLKKHGRIYTKHYSVYPESERAIYSIISGKYPPLSNGDTWKQKFKPSGLANFLKGQGYSTYFLGTAPLEFHDDRTLVERLGFENIYNVKETLSAQKIVNGKKTWDRTKIYHFDQILIRKALEIITSHSGLQKKEPFFMVLAPQSSHAPFQIPPGNSSVTTSDGKRIRLNAIWQFRLLKLIIHKLALTGNLKDTVLVITGDHGIRSKYESNLFADPNLLQSVSFHVPLMIAFSEMRPSFNDDYVTSHVDLATTILNGFHVRSRNEIYHGVDLFNFPLPERNVFLFGGGYLPVSGLINDDGYFMENRYLMLAYKSRQFNFSDNSSAELVGQERDNFSNKMISIQYLLNIE